MDLERIKKFRKYLHSLAEPSMQEYKTKQALMDFIKENTSLEIKDMGSWFYAKYINNHEPIAFRAEFDAVLCSDGKARHLCGHDGHSAILAGLALELERMKQDGMEINRDVYLIFQPGEETGQGGKICSEILKKKKIEEIYSLHNIPSFPENQILLRNHTFACASTGMEITLTGKPSHAAYPEQGVNPALLIADLIQYANDLIGEPHKGIVLATVIGADIGSNSYGVSAEKGRLRFTLRAELQEEYDQLLKAIRDKATREAKKQGLECTINLIEEFPSTENHLECVNRIKAAADSLNLSIVYPDAPFRWSEDFGYYLKDTKGAIFGLGCGENHPGLHTENYEFNDAVIETAISLYLKCIREKEEEKHE